MTEIENQLLKALLQLEEAVASMPTAQPKPDLLPIFSRLDSLGQQLPASTDPQLRHFMQRKSYQKARALLQETAGSHA